MTRQEHLKFCKYCTRQSFDLNKGIICSITNEVATFQDFCPDFDPMNDALQDSRKDSAAKFITDDSNWNRELEMIGDSGWNKYKSPEYLPNSIVIHENRITLLLGIFGVAYLIYVGIRDLHSEFNNVVIGYILISAIAGIILYKIYELIVGKFYFKVSEIGITTPERETILWEEISFIVLARYPKTRSILIKRINKTIPDELFMKDANYSLEKVGHILYMYRRKSEKN